MSVHADICNQLYEYLRGELSAEESQRLSDHLERCIQCRAACDAVRDTLQILPATDTDPASTLPRAFWLEVLQEVEHRITPHPASVPPSGRLEAWLRARHAPGRRLVLGFASLVLVAVSALITWQVLRHDAPSQLAETQAERQDTVQTAGASPDLRLQQYLQKSRILLTGVTHLPVRDDIPVDFSIERRASRELVSESRFLKQRFYDDRSVRLIDDMQKVLIELANADEHVPSTNLALVREGIERENLLFRLRIAESVNKQVRYADDR